MRSELQVLLSAQISTGTIECRMNEIGYWGRVARKEIFVNDLKKRKRFVYAARHIKKDQPVSDMGQFFVTRLGPVS